MNASFCARSGLVRVKILVALFVISAFASSGMRPPLAFESMDQRARSLGSNLARGFHPAPQPKTIVTEAVLPPSSAERSVVDARLVPISRIEPMVYVVALSFRTRAARAYVRAKTC